MPLLKAVQTCPVHTRAFLRLPTKHSAPCAHGSAAPNLDGLLHKESLAARKFYLSRNQANSSVKTSNSTMKIFSHSTASRALLGLLPLTAAFARPNQARCRHTSATYATDLKELNQGVEAYIERMSTTNPGLLSNLALQGQKPPFMVVECSDSRISEQDIFSAKPGTMFTARNIANQFLEEDLTSNSILSYAVDALGVRHVIVMGHYGCGGVAASMIPPPPVPLKTAQVAVQNWIQPIRDVYLTSTRAEIVAHREKALAIGVPQLHDPAFRALVEENVKANVKRLAESTVIQDHYKTLMNTSCESSSDSTVADVFIHGWVYDIENGRVSDLRVSVGPPGKPIPTSPFPVCTSETCGSH